MKEVKRRRFRLIGMKGDELRLEGGGEGWSISPSPCLLSFVLHVTLIKTKLMSLGP